jgi:hypothetical protein
VLYLPFDLFISQTKNLSVRVCQIPAYQTGEVRAAEETIRVNALPTAGRQE